MEIHPYEGVGELRFGQSRQSVHEALGSRYTTFRKGNSASETDAYDNLGLHLYYDDNDRLEFIEAFKPALISFHKIAFGGRSVDEIEAELNRLGYTCERRDDGLQSDSAGMALYAPSGIIESVSAFRRGYYDL